MKYLTLLFAVLLSGCVSWQWGHSPEPHGIPMGTHTEYEWQIVEGVGQSMWPYLKSGEPVIVVKVPWEELVTDKYMDAIILSWREDGVRYGPFHRRAQVFTHDGKKFIRTRGSNGDYDMKKRFDWHIVSEDNYVAIFAYTVAEYEANQ